MEEETRATLVAGLAALGGEPGRMAAGEPGTVAAVGRYLSLLAAWNERINLTAISTEAEMVVKHVLDSASVCAAVEWSPGMRVLDVGTGAGFPGIILKLLVPEIRLTLLESVQKKCRFLEAAVESLELSGTEVIWRRAEDLAHQPEYRGKYDVVVARAVAELRVLAELCLPFCRPGGRFLAMKGPGAAAELSAAGHALRVLGGVPEREEHLTLPGGAGQRTLVLVRKVGGTARAYPRKAGTPQRQPL